MEPALPIDDSEDEACQYLVTVKNQASEYLTRFVSLGTSENCSIEKIPKSLIPEEYEIPLSKEKQGIIVRKFVETKREIEGKLNPKEITRSKKMIKRWVYFEKPTMSIVGEFDHLTVWKVLECIEEWLDDFEQIEEWIYGMLMLINLPLSLDIYSALNSIMIKAIEFSPKPSALVIIIIISEHFGQKLH